MTSKKSDLAAFEAVVHRVKTSTQCTEKQARELVRKQLTKADREKRR
jgi:hypothetical protein